MDRNNSSAQQRAGKGESRLVVVGLKRKHLDLLVQLSSRWNTDVIEKGESDPPEWFPEHPSLRYIREDAASYLVWSRMDLDNLTGVISTVSEHSLNRELCHILFDRLKTKLRFFILAEDRDPQKNQELRERYGAQLISPSALAQEMLLNRLLTRTILPLNIGLGKGEMLEVEISARSHLVDRPLRHLRPKEWHIAAIYRQGRLLLPTGEVALQVGDRVILVGDPTVLSKLAEALLKGEPQFPRPYGSQIAVPFQEDWEYVLEELALWAESCSIRNVHAVSLKPGSGEVLGGRIEERIGLKVTVGEKNSLKGFLAALPYDSGLVVVPKRGRNCRRFFRSGRLSVPVLLAGGKVPYDRVVAGLDGEWPDLTLDIALDVSRVLALPLEAYITRQPWEIGGDDSVRRMEARESLIRDLSTIQGQDLPLHSFEGNPVTEAVNWLNRQNPLLVISYRPGEYARWLLAKPVLAPILSEKYSGSVLLVPVIDASDNRA